MSENTTETKNEITLQDVEKFINENPEGKSWLNSRLDSAVSKGNNTFQENFMKEKFPKLLEDEITKRFPPQTEEQKRLKELELKFQEAENEKLKAKLQARLLKVASDSGIPDFFVDYSIDKDEDTSINKLKELGAKYVETVNKAVEARLAGTGRPAGGSGNDGKTNTINLDDLKSVRNMDTIRKNKDALEALLKKALAEGN